MLRNGRKKADSTLLELKRGKTQGSAELEVFRELGIIEERKRQLQAALGRGNVSPAEATEAATALLEGYNNAAQKVSTVNPYLAALIYRDAYRFAKDEGREQAAKEIANTGVGMFREAVRHFEKKERKEEMRGLIREGATFAYTSLGIEKLRPFLEEFSHLLIGFEAERVVSIAGQQPV